MLVGEYPICMSLVSGSVRRKSNGSGIALPFFRHPIKRGFFMRKTYIRFVVPVFVFLLALVISGNIPTGHLFALQAGGGAAQGGTNTGSSADTGSGNVQPGYPGSNTYGTGTDQNPEAGTSPDNNYSSGSGMNQAGIDNNASPNNNAGSNVGVGQTPTGQGTTSGSQGVGAIPGGAAQAANTDNANRSVPWGSIIISFIAGLVIGGLLFGRRQTTIDRTNLRRTA
jgi:hypothetical protein